ncbi:ABC transporter ATP-binding protein [Nocardioides gilvus]|uniref:ABC transporter ATP-binding protein n=1 Tax=Nocardioides gilvus TaxID=1735589 RepID=UPI000D7486EE|nr:ABC transporter ATP-binding protein [Nocardioides gilvus]
MISVEGISVSYRQGGSLIVPLRSVSFEVKVGSSVALTGPSGSGKSTLLRVLAGLQRPDAGVVSLHGESDELNPSDPRVSLIHQDFRLVEFLNVLDNLRLAAEVNGLNVSTDSLQDVLGDVGLSGFGHRLPATLSGGEQQRVAIARSVVSGAEVLLADEPTGNLDPENTTLVTELLIDIAVRHRKVVIVATHDLGVAESMALWLRLVDGRVVPEERSLV